MKISFEHYKRKTAFAYSYFPYHILICTLVNTARSNNQKITFIYIYFQKTAFTTH